MTPVPVYCRRCGGFTGEHRMMARATTKPRGTHEHLEDCVERLAERLAEIEKARAEEWWL